MGGIMGKSAQTRRTEINSSITTNRFRNHLGRYVLEIIRTKWNGLTQVAKLNIAGQCGLGTKKGNKAERDFRRLAIAVALLDVGRNIPNPKRTVKGLDANHISGFVRRCLPRATQGLGDPKVVALLRKNATRCWNRATGGTSGVRIVNLSNHHIIRPGDSGHGLIRYVRPQDYFSVKQNRESRFKGIWNVTPQNGAPIRIYPTMATAQEPFGSHTSMNRPNPEITNRLNAYYLPWEPGWCVKYTIPANARNNSLFLTSALSGCSIFVRGPADNPTVYHCGMDAKYWDEASANKLFMDPTNRNPQVVREYNLGIRNAIQNKNAHTLYELIVKQEGNFNGAVQSSDYAKGNTACRVCRNPKSTPELEHIHRRIQRQLTNTRLLDGADGHCSGFGMVFGIKRNDDWSFYLQGGINLSIISPDGLHKWVFTQPTHIQRFFPDNNTRRIDLAINRLNLLNENIIDFGQNAP
jgi:hypothetical protein